ncbi:probable starch synthase 4, chloroplastic/amyloplastic isoform X1 [Nicotiana sylvestris]|uniref:starch synthase n=3 Tax=Nicotiana TaxID=4085 RepID=A0A1U7XJJ0_NICSY|nr:PREDICTED: probable starch synthase 4, chloroplastic/amyloplastic isoform X1 [Nicotiana sylvestris]XP_016480754.1 PREDICTED: probable starch synthase 4, chloroplastic/amyloplastic isoform X1 [Nicotiana tabacum]XP_016480761.1 PREDICTED: probable starch synthase 4, chloroplastic/amyloplastic isoform X2 [Nicotiana tabacum]
MITEMLSSLSIAKTPPPPLLMFSPANGKPFRASVICCVGKNAERNGSTSGPFQLELGNHSSDENIPQMKSAELEEKGSDIWQLFREAQQNILYLNKQRIMAMEELDRVKREKSSLLDQIEQLERTKLINTRKDKFSISAELLLRIDSMVLSSLIDSKEASDFRRLVMDSKVSIVDYFSDIMHKQDTRLLVELRHFSGKSRTSGYHIIHICTEMAPVVSVGSLAQYVTGLSCALQRNGNLVEIILPKYASLNLNEVHGLREVEAEFFSYFNGQMHSNRIWTGVVYGIGVTFIEPLYYSSFFSREKVYGYSNDFERFTYFSRASLDYIVKAGKQPDVLHIHNWETSIVGPLFWDVFVDQGLGDTRIMLTCQSFESQCVEQPEKLALCGLDPHRLHRSDRLQDNNKSHLVNVLKAGVVYSNKVIIMASMQTKGQIIHAMSHGLEPTLTIHKDKLLVAPGFDSSAWDPSADKFLPQNYSADNMKGKSVCKVSLQQHLGLQDQASIILVGCIFSDISDVELENLKTLIWMASRRGVQFVFMGSGQTPGLNKALEYFEEELKDENMRFLSKNDEALAHLVLAGSDIMLCPSFDDTVLQVPLKAMRYGAVPILLNFTDSNFGHFMDHDLEGTKFSRYIKDTFANMSLNQAIEGLKNNPSKWDKKIVDAMTKDFSWEAECCDIHISAYTAIKN